MQLNDRHREGLARFHRQRGSSGFGAGTRESDYAGPDVRGKIVLAAAQAGEVEDLAVALHGALGIVE
jgi:hypothetical protein